MKGSSFQRNQHLNVRSWLDAKVLLFVLSRFETRFKRININSKTSLRKHQFSQEHSFNGSILFCDEKIIKSTNWNDIYIFSSSLFVFLLNFNFETKIRWKLLCYISWLEKSTTTQKVAVQRAQQIKQSVLTLSIFNSRVSDVISCDWG